MLIFISFLILYLFIAVTWSEWENCSVFRTRFRDCNGSINDIKYKHKFSRTRQIEFKRLTIKCSFDIFKIDKRVFQTGVINYDSQKMNKILFKYY